MQEVIVYREIKGWTKNYFFFRQIRIFPNLFLSRKIFRRREKPDRPFWQFLYVPTCSLKQNHVWMSRFLNLSSRRIFRIRNLMIFRYQNLIFPNLKIFRRREKPGRPFWQSLYVLTCSLKQNHVWMSRFRSLSFHRIFRIRNQTCLRHLSRTIFLSRMTFRRRAMPDHPFWRSLYVLIYSSMQNHDLSHFRSRYHFGNRRENHVHFPNDRLK